jgi:hypothetical protein
VAGTTGIAFGTNTYNCNAPGYLSTSTASMKCEVNGISATGIFSQVSNNCTAITCSAQAANGYAIQSGLAYTPTAGSGSIVCNQAGYSGTASYTCFNAGTAINIGTCGCATGYVKDANNICVNKCTIPASNGTTQIVTNSLNVSGNGTCATGYTGYFSYNCSAAAIGTITLNNCYQGTFTEKLFTYTTSTQNVSGSPGAWYGLTWPDILTLNLPVDYLFTSRVHMINGFYYSCGGYGTYHNAGISKTSGYGTTGGIIGSYCEPQPGSYNTSCNAGPQLMNPGIELRNGDVLRFSTSNYTGCGYSNAYFTFNLYYMAKPSCTVGGSSGMVSKVVYGGSSGSDGTCQDGYSGSYNWSCDNYGVSSVTNNCTAINCTISGTGYVNKSVSGSNSFNCDAGFAGTINYTCTGATTATTSGTCVAITCTAPATNGYGTQSSLAFTPSAGSRSITCSQAGYTGNVAYTCSSSGVATNIGVCGCAAGYVKDNNGACVVATCPVSLIGISNTSVNSGTGNFTCGNGYSGTVGYSCGCGSVTSYTSAGAGDYTKNPHYGQIFASFVAPTTGKLKNLKVKISGAFNNSGYITFKSWDSTGKSTADRGFQLSSLTDVTIDLSSDNITLLQGQTQSFQFTTFTEYLYFAAYVKADNSLVYTVDFETNSGVCSVPTLSTSGVCTPITCTVNAPNTTTNGTAVNYTTTATALTCNPGFAGSPTYTCTGTSNPGSFVQGGTACTPITCTVNAPNTTTNGTAVNYITTATPLTCNAGFTGSPTYTCAGTSNPGSFVQGGTPCVAAQTFTPSWTTANINGGYYYNATSATISVAGNNSGGSNIDNNIFTLIPRPMNIRFKWKYCTDDRDGPRYDPGRLYINNQWITLVNSGGAGCYEGSSNLNASANTLFGPGVLSTDGQLGRAYMNFTDIVFTDLLN